MRHMKWVLLLVFFVMVAGVSSADPSTSTMKEFNVGRAFAHCVKLTGTNYQIWITGIISTIVGISGVSQLENVRKILEYFESNGHKTIEKIDEELTALISAGKSRKVPGSLNEASNLLYTILNVTIDSEKLSHLVSIGASKAYRSDGIAYLKHIYGKNGPGDASRQTANRLKLSDEKQNEMETGEEFGGRLLPAQ